MSENLFPIPVGPANADLVTGFIKGCKDLGLDFCPSDPSANEPSSLFFYHTPKTGGMRFMMPIATSIEGIAFNADKPLIQRLLQSSCCPSRIASHTRGDQDISSAENFKGFVFYSDHQAPFGLHRRIRDENGKQAITATILREPNARLKSALKYLWRINKQDTSETLEAIKHGHLHVDNPITRIFSGKTNEGSKLIESDVAKAITSLSELDFCLHQENYSPVRRLQHAFISEHRMPNILCASRINETPIIPPPEVLDELEAAAHRSNANQYDREVYNQYICGNPIDNSPSALSLNSLHPLTFIFEARTEADAGTFFASTSKLVPTIDLLLGRVELPSNTTASPGVSA